jgi:predicted MFS family arabinose efflux permease
VSPEPAPKVWGGALLLFITRVIYAFNWYNIGAVLPLVGRTFHATTSALGIVLGAFLVGVGIFQIPAGLVDLRWGPRRTSLFGAALMGGACFLSGFAPTLLLLAGLRFVAGVGAAFFFSPALSLISSYFPPGRRGPVIGLYNGGFSLGGAIGLGAGAVTAIGLGWPFALGIGGAGLLAMAGIGHWGLPPEPRAGRTPDAAERWRSTAGIFRSRSIWALALALTGFWGAIFIAAQYFVEYVHAVHPVWGIGLAGVLAAVLVLVSFPGGPLGGWIAERSLDRRAVLVVFAVGTGVLVLLVPFLGLTSTAVDFAVLGLLDGVAFAVLYVIPTYLPESRGHGVALGIAFVNSVQVLLGSGIAIGFGFIADAAGFTVAWLYAGVLTVALVPLLAWVQPSRGRSPPERDALG